MIKHVVMWRLREEAGGQPKEANARDMKGWLEALSGQIPQIRSLEVGLNISSSKRAWDVVLVTSFENEADLAAYISHPQHQAVVASIRAISAEARVVDFVAGDPVA